MKRALIIGGGIIGQFTAHYLLKSSDYEVTILDEESKMGSASFGNCGLIRPSRIFPLNSWHTVFQGLKWMGKKDAPLYIQSKLEYEYLKWFLTFALKSHSVSVNKAMLSRKVLLEKSWGLYHQLVSEDLSESVTIANDLVYAASNEKGIQFLENDNKRLPLELKTELLSGAELRQLEPSINENIIGGGLCKADGSINPSLLLSEMKKLNAKNGAKFITDRVTSIKSTNHTIEVKSNNNTYTADEYVLCAGARSLQLAKGLNISLPIQPAKGYHLTGGNVDTQPTRPIYMIEKKVVATPWKDAFRIGSTMEFAGFDLSLDSKRLDTLKIATESYLNIDTSKLQLTPWAGWRPMTSSGSPIIRREKQHPNLVIATGHGMLGLSMAPATGLMVKQIISDEK